MKKKKDDSNYIICVSIGSILVSTGAISDSGLYKIFGFCIGFLLIFFSDKVLNFFR